MSRFFNCLLKLLNQKIEFEFFGNLLFAMTVVGQLIREVTLVGAAKLIFVVGQIYYGVQHRFFVLLLVVVLKNI